MNYLQVSLGSLPINLACIENGCVAFMPVGAFAGVIDCSLESFNVIFTTSGFSINGKDYEYSAMYSYKNHPDMLQWLKAQNLQVPDMQQGFF